MREAALIVLVVSMISTVLSCGWYVEKARREAEREKVAALCRIADELRIMNERMEGGAGK
jgi:hypothetical protein